MCVCVRMCVCVCVCVCVCACVHVCLSFCSRLCTLYLGIPLMTGGGVLLKEMSAPMIDGGSGVPIVCALKSKERRYFLKH